LQVAVEAGAVIVTATGALELVVLKQPHLSLSVLRSQ
jgi:hypothetical protein